MEATRSTLNAVPEVRGIEIFGYGFGGLAVNLLYMVVSNYIIFFFTDIAGISVVAAGAIFAASKLVDAFTDPVMGSIIDGTKSRFGRMRPYMMFGSFTAAIAMVALFTSLPGVSHTGRVVYYFAVYCIWSITYTIVGVPYQSSVSLISSNRHKRNLLVMSGKLVAVGAGLVVANIYNIVDLFGGGQRGWQMSAMVFGLIAGVCLWICALSTKRFDTRERAIADNRKKSGEKVTVKDRLRVVASNKPLMMLMLAFGTNNLAQAATQTVQSYYAKYVLEDIGFIARAGSISSVLMIPMFILVPFLCRRFTKRNLFIVGTVIHIIPAFVFAIMGLRISGYVRVAEVFTIISSLGGFFCNILAFMMIPDCVDFGKRKLGIFSAAIVTSTFTFCNKISTALGGFIVSGVLDYTGYNPNDVQTIAVLMTIVMAMVIPTVFSDICSTIGMLKYKINEHAIPDDTTEPTPA